MDAVIILSRTMSPQGELLCMYAKLMIVHVISDYRYTDQFENNTFIINLKQLCKMMTYTCKMTEFEPILFCFYLPNKSSSQGIRTLHKSMPCTLE